MTIGKTAGAGLLALLGAAGFIVACSSDTKEPVDQQRGADAAVEAASDEDGGADAAQSCGIISVGDESCDTCLVTECCRENATCSDDPNCIELLDCSSACKAGDSACTDACAEAHPDGLTPLSNLGGCVREYCGSSCQ